MTVSEALKLAVIIVTVYHLLIMVTMHLAGVTSPVKFKKVRHVFITVYGKLY